MREARAQRRERPGHGADAGAGGRAVRAPWSSRPRGSGFGYGDRPVIRDLTTTIMRGDKVGIIGPNGSGKTTLLRLLLGQLAAARGDGPPRDQPGGRLLRPAEGHARRGEDRPAERRATTTRSSINGQPRHVLGYLQDFLFPPERSRSLVKFLSGGERSRLLLAKLFTRPSNVLVLDEPTNDLDVETLELLESLLVDYQGTVLLVSHDRAFLNDVVTSTLAIEADGRVKEYDGGYDDYLRQRQAEAPAAPKAATAPAKARRPRERSGPAS